MLSVADFEVYAGKILSKSTLGFYNTGSLDDWTVRWNTEAFRRYRLRPRMLRDVSRVTLETSVLGEHIDSPIGVAPTALQCLAHPHGEQATARACSAMDTVMVASVFATKSMEEIAEASGNGLLWQQLYLNKNRIRVPDLIRRAEHAGFKAIVVTIDSPVTLKKMGILRNDWELPRHLPLANYPSGSRDSMIANVRNSFNQTTTWEDIRWLCGFTHLPIMVKGLLRADDAKLAVESGVSAILVSNHGGRQLDSDMATIDVLSEVVCAVEGRVEVYMDGGVRQGTDVLKALALGARAVFIGRPILWGLSYKGETGVCKVLQILKDELKLAMMLSGCRTLSEIGPDTVVHESYYHRARL